MNFSRRRLLVVQIVVVAVLGCGMKVDAMWHVPQLFITVRYYSLLFSTVHCSVNTAFGFLSILYQLSSRTFMIFILWRKCKVGWTP